MRASTWSVCCQVAPPSRVTNTPRSGFSPHRWPSAATNTVLLSVGSVTMREMVWVALKPTGVQWSPPSTERYTPSPHEEELRLFASPVPTHTRAGFFCHTSTAPIDCSGCLSNSALQVVPWLVVLKSPPVPVARKKVAGRFSTTAKSEIRPPQFAGPIERHASSRNRPGSRAIEAGRDRAAAGAPGAGRPGAAPVATASSSAASPRERRERVGRAGYGRRRRIIGVSWRGLRRPRR